MYWDKNRESYVGITHDTLQLISKKTGIKFKYVPFESYDMALSAVKAGSVDVMFSVNQTSDLQKSDSYFTKKASLIVERTSKTHWSDYFSDSSSESVAAVVEGTGLDKMLDLKKHGHNVKFVHTPIEAIALVSFGDADYTIMDLAEFGYYQKKLDSHLLIPGDESQLLEIATSFGFSQTINKHVPAIFEKALASFSAQETLFISAYWDSYKYVEPTMRAEFFVFLIVIILFITTHIVWAQIYKHRLKSQERMLNTKWLRAVNETLAVERQTIRAQLANELKILAKNAEEKS